MKTSINNPFGNPKSLHGQRKQWHFAWLTDIHLEFLTPAEIGEFLRQLIELKPDGLLVSGDIVPAAGLQRSLEHFSHHLNAPIYFVLGNHDFWGSDVSDVRSAMTVLTAENPRIGWMPVLGVVELAPGVGLVGHDGWGDGRNGDFMRSDVFLNDYVKIESLSGLGRVALLERLHALGDESAAHLRAVIPEAAARYDRVYVMTHPPPYREACFYKGKAAALDSPYLPHFTCKAVGDVLLEMADTYRNTNFTVLCGHVHYGGEVLMRPNLHIHVGGAEYGHPRVEKMLTFPR